MSKNTTFFDKDITPVLEKANNEDLGYLVQLLTKQLTSTLDAKDVYEKNKPNHTVYADLIAEEICAFGGNTFVNIFRQHGPAYKEIVCDVASKLSASYNSKSDIETIENAIIGKILEKALDKMTDDDKRELLKEMGDKRSASLTGPALTSAIMLAFRAGGFLSYQILVIVANAIAKTVLGSGLKFATNAALTKWASILVGPVGWVITGIWTAIDIAGPAYRVTIPAAVFVAMLRRKYDSPYCPNCNQMIPVGVKFCPECGERI